MSQPTIQEYYRMNGYYEYIDYVNNGVLYKNVPVRKVLVTSDSQLDDLTEYGPGTIAYNINTDTTWTMDGNGDWSTGPVMMMVEATDDGEGNITITEADD